MESFDAEGEPSPRAFAVAARILRGEQIAADTAGIPPLDSDQVLDLQRNAGNRLTSGALTRWTGPRVAQELLGELLAARTTDPARYDAICAALDGLEPLVGVQLTGPDAPVVIDARGPHGGRAFEVTPPAIIELSFKAAFGGAAEIEPEHALLVRIGEHALALPVPFAEPATAGGYVALAELR